MIRSDEQTTPDLPPAVLRALDINRDSTAWERTVDITTTGAKTGRPRRIEIWFHKIHGRWYLSSTPARRAWYTNLLAHPLFTFHLKHGIQVDLPSTAMPVPDPQERQRIFQHIVDDFNQPHDPARIGRNQHVEDWIAGSPLIEIRFNTSLGKYTETHCTSAAITSSVSEACS